MRTDWLAFNLPRQGSADLARDHLTSDIPTCSPSDRLSHIRGLFDHHPLRWWWPSTTSESVMGMVDTDQLEAADPDARVEEVMREGPTTVRGREETEGLSERMRNAGVDTVLLISSDGKLLGLYRHPREEQFPESARLAQHRHQDRARIERPRNNQPAASTVHTTCAEKLLEA